MVTKIISNNHQNFQDLSIQGAGSLEYIFEIGLLNGYSITDSPIPGSKIVTPEIKKSGIYEYYQKKGIVPTTGSTTADIYIQQLFENGLFQPGLFE